MGPRADTQDTAPRKLTQSSVSETKSRRSRPIAIAEDRHADALRPQPHGLKRKDYEKKLRKLHVKLVELQDWVRQEGLKICIVFEGRDGAGKGGAIKAITARVSPRIFRVV